MTDRVDSEDIETTSTEKLLAVVLAVFMLIGGLWFYFQPLDRDDYDRPAFKISAADERILDSATRADDQVQKAKRGVRVARERVEIKREEYRTALDANRPAAMLEREFRRGQAQVQRAETRERDARAQLARERPAARAAEARISAADSKASREADRRADRASRETFLLRLLYVLLSFGAALLLLRRLRNNRSRYALVGLAAVGATTAQAAVMATDYTTDYIDVYDLGPLALSLAGIAMTLGAIVALQRYVARRTPLRRVRKRECPFCGFPVAGNPRCEGCGREVISVCSTCGAGRRVGSEFCGSCGSA